MMEENQNPQIALAVFGERIENFGRQLTDTMAGMKEVMGEVANAVRQITAVNERIELHREEHDKGLKRAFDAIEIVENRITKKQDDLENRMRDVEKKLPTITLTSGWVLGGAGLIGATVLAAALKILFGW